MRKLHAAGALLTVAATLSFAGVVAARGHPGPRAATGGAARESFAVTTTQRGPDDDVPAAGTKKMREDHEAVALGLRWDEARRATTQAGYAVFVLPAAKDGVCLVLHSLANGSDLACGSAADAAEGRIMVRIMRDDSTTLVAGLMPDGVDRVTVRTDVTRSTRVENNTYVVEAGRADGSLAWTRHGQARSVPVPGTLLPPPLPGAAVHS